MGSERYVLLGLAPARAAWFDRLARWATAATVAAEFVKCVSAEEVRARLASGRQHSALLVDVRSASLDRDVVDVARAALTPVVVIGAGTAFPADDLGVAAVLAHDFGRDDLLEALAQHARMISSGDRLPPGLRDETRPLWLGQLYTVCGPGGTGATTVAMALAQGLASAGGRGHRVLLADLARRGDLAMLHDAAELGPGLQDLVEAHRVGRPEIDELAGFTFQVPRRGYRLLLGLRRPEAWSTLRPRAVDASIEGLRRAFPVVVADVTADVEGEAEGGSLEVEERNHPTRAALMRSAVVLAVGAPGLKGVHSLSWLIRALLVLGVAPGRIVTVVNRAPRSPVTRSEIARTLSSLLAGGAGASGPLAAPLFLPERKVEEALRDGTPLPAALTAPVVKAVLATADRNADRAPAPSVASLIAPGSLGSWPEAADA